MYNVSIPKIGWTKYMKRANEIRTRIKYHWCDYDEKRTKFFLTLS